MGTKMVEFLSKLTTSSKEAAPDILILQFTIVNAYLVGKPNHNNWTLVDTGLENSADYILQAAEERFGKDARPQAIVLTHGHFDHVGSLSKLSQHWDIPVYAHELELPYITGQKDYPAGDPSVGGGLVSQISPTFPHTSINLGNRAEPLPSDHSIPGMSGWKWIHTPGHTEGHVALFREADRILIPGDAFTTLKQESLYSVITQNEQISGPPAYLTTDWESAELSVRRLQGLEPSLVVPSHGQPMQGEELKRHLTMLTKHFEEIAVPDQGQFVSRI